MEWKWRKGKGGQRNRGGGSDRSHLYGGLVLRQSRSGAMVSLPTWCRYFKQKLAYSVAYTVKSQQKGHISEAQMLDSVWKNLLQGKLTYLHWYKGEEMAPAITGEGQLLVRKIPRPSPMSVFVGDVVVLKDPEKPSDYLVRRLAAIEGYEMVSNNEKDEPFVLEEDQCWVLADNESVKPKDARDSRLLGPLNLKSIVGRVLYSLRSPVDHGPVENSHAGMNRDLAILAVELDVSEMMKNQKP